MHLELNFWLFGVPCEKPSLSQGTGLVCLFLQQAVLLTNVPGWDM